MAYDVEREIVIHSCRCDEYINQSLWQFLSPPIESVFQWEAGIATELTDLQ